MTERNAVRIIFILVVCSVFSTLVASGELLEPATTTKAIWMRCFVLLALPLYVCVLLARPRLRPDLSNPLTLAVLAFGAVNILATHLGINPRVSFWGGYDRMGGLFQLVHLILIYFYVLLLATWRRGSVAFLLQFLVWLAGLSSLYAVLEACGMRPWVIPDPQLPDRVSSVFGHSVFFAGFLVLPMALALLFWRRTESTAGKCCYLGLFALQLSGVLLSGTRGVMVALFVGAFAAGSLCWFRHCGDLYRRIVAVGLLAAPIIAVVLLTCAARWLPQNNVLHRFSDLQDGSARGRIIEWQVAWAGYKERPLLGTGPENYHVVHNKHYDQRLYKHWPGAFDKPHNYLVEIFVTTGLFGGIAYLAVFVLTLLSFWWGYRTHALSWTECVVLVAGILAYHVQNAFIFDMPASSLAFYIYTGFAGSLCIVTPRPDPEEDAGPLVLSRSRTLLVVGAATACIYVVLIADVITAVQLRDLAKARVLGHYGDLQSAKTYFDKAAESVFVYDRRKLGLLYGDFAAGLPISKGDPWRVDTRFAESAIYAATSALEKTSKIAPDDPAVWLRLASLYNLRTELTGGSADPRAKTAAESAIELAPNRVEPRYYLAQYYMAAKRPEEAFGILEQIVQRAPENAGARWHLAQAYAVQGNTDLAVQNANEAFRLGYDFKSFPEFLWLIDYYIDKQDYWRVTGLYERAIRFRPDDSRLYESLAATYAKLQQNDKAIAAANKVLELDPSREVDTETFLRSLMLK